ncbi:MAG: hypothetical protein ACOC1K_05130, partial [Nanoarchaeota archaeon]
YIGTTNSNRFDIRMKAHENSERFNNHKFSFEILEKSENIEFLEKEQYYINLYDSYNNGLNGT